MHSTSNSDAISVEIEETLSILLDDEVEQSHIFGEQSSIALLTISSDHNKQQRSASFHLHKPSKSSAWHGSCASFLGNNSELLHLSSSLNESNESCVYLALHANDQALGHAPSKTTSSTEQGIITLEQEINKGIAQERYGPTRDSSQRKMVTTNINSLVSLNESRFNSSTILSDRSDKLPRRPKRDICDDDDGTDADFSDIITVNPYDSICTTLAETMSIIDNLFDASALTICEGTLKDTSHKPSSSDNNVSRKPTFRVPLDERSCIPIAGNSTLSSKGYSVGYSMPKEDEAPKRPIRGVSPPRFIDKRQ